MATIRQKKLANEIVENLQRTKPLNKQELLEKVGYSHTVAIGKPKEIFQSEGLKESLEELGWSSENAKKKVGSILNKEYAEDRDIIAAAKLVFQVEGDMAPEKHLIVTKKIISVDE